MSFDPGLQAERTLLAWERTCLSVAVCGALLLHLSVESLGLFGAAVAGATLCLSLSAHLASRRRYNAVHRDLQGCAPIQDAGVPCALVSLAVVALAVVALGVWVGRAAEAWRL